MPFIIQITCLGQIIGYLWVTSNPLDLNGNTRNIQRRTYKLCNISLCDIILFSGNINQLYKITVYVESRSKILQSLFMNCVLESNFSLLTSIEKHPIWCIYCMFFCQILVCNNDHITCNYAEIFQVGGQVDQLILVPVCSF